MMAIPDTYVTLNSRKSVKCQKEKWVWHQSNLKKKKKKKWKQIFPKMSNYSFKTPLYLQQQANKYIYTVQRY